MKASLIACALLLLAVVLCYRTAWSCGFVYDDHRLILQQAAPAGAGDYAGVFHEAHYPGMPYYRPVTRLLRLSLPANV